MSHKRTTLRTHAPPPRGAARARDPDVRSIAPRRENASRERHDDDDGHHHSRVRRRHRAAQRRRAVVAPRARRVAHSSRERLARQSRARGWDSVVRRCDDARRRRRAPRAGTSRGEICAKKRAMGSCRARGRAVDGRRARRGSRSRIGIADGDTISSARGVGSRDGCFRRGCDARDGGNGCVMGEMDARWDV